MSDFFSDQISLNAAVDEARAALDAYRASNKEWDSTTKALSTALNEAIYAAKLPTINFARFATKALGKGWFVMPAGQHRKVDVWSPSGATCRNDVDATKEAVLVAAESLAKSYWSFADTSTGSVGQSWWDE